MHTKEVETAKEDDLISELSSDMRHRRFRHIPVVDESGYPIAMVSIGDISISQQEQLQAQNQMLEQAQKKLSKWPHTTNLTSIQRVNHYN